MKINFFKYQGTGNDFIMLDNMNGGYEHISIDAIQFLCDRKMGIGADGFIKLSSCDDALFEVEYFNADGSQSFCGNGARCSIAFAQRIGIIRDFKTLISFRAIDGLHQGSIESSGIVNLEMLPVDSFSLDGEDYVINTGSPHYVRLINQNDFDIVDFGKKIRFSEKYAKEGINVNSLRVLDDQSIEVQTYERGVEDETLSCGTGVTACALAYIDQSKSDLGEVQVRTKGGDLKVNCVKLDNGGFNQIWLSGPATFVYCGSIEI